MKVALTVWENRISPLFDSARMLLIVDIVDRMETGRCFESFHCESPFSRAVRLSDLKIEVLICGAVSNLFADVVEARGIRIIPFITGLVDEVLDAYLTGRLDHSEFQMPGCNAGNNKGFREER